MSLNEEKKNRRSIKNAKRKSIRKMRFVAICADPAALKSTGQRRF
jgi:hypothetical protein